MWDPTTDPIGEKATFLGGSFCKAFVMLAAAFGASHALKQPSPEAIVHCKSCYNNYPDTRVEVGEGAFPVSQEGAGSDKAELLVSNTEETKES